MALKHDAQGFLAGDPIDIGRALAVWDDIHEDVRAIRRAITEAGTMQAPGQSARSPAVKAFNEVAQPMARSAPARRDANQVPALLRKPATPQTGGAGGNSNRRDAQATAATSQAVAAVRAANQVVQKAVAKPAARDGRGRFVRSGAGEGRAPGAPGAGSGSGEDGNGEAGVMRSIADRIVGAVKESGAGMEEADPAVKAFNEVAQPMARGYELMTGGDKDKRQEGWLRRIYTSLTGLRNEETVFNKAANKSLKNIAEKPEAKSGGDGGGVLGMMSGLLSKIPGVGPMLSGGAGMMGGIGKGLMGAGKGLLRRIPLIGALIGGVGAASDIYSSETDDSLTRREKDQRAGKAVGGFAGSVGGMLAGAKLGAMAGAIGGPIGVAIGGVLGGAVGMFFGDQAGQIIGDTVGGWVSDLREADIPGKIVAAWEATTDFLKRGWNFALDRLEQGWKSVKDAGNQAVEWAGVKANSANSYIKDKTGIDIKATAGAAKDKAVEIGSQAVDGIKQGADWTANNTTIGRGAVKAWEGAKAIGGKIGERWGDAKQYLLGASDKAGVDAGTVAKIANFESGFNADAMPVKKDGTKISSAHGYGQFLDGTWTAMLNKYGSKYGVEGAGSLTKDQAAKFRGDKTVQAGMLAEFTRENIEKGRKFGGADDDANVYAFHNLGDKDAKNLLSGMKQDPSMTVRDALLNGATSDKERARIEQVISGNKSLYGDGNVTAAEAYTRMGKVMRRGEAFAADARQAQGAPVIAQASPPQTPSGVVAPAAPVVTSASAPPVSVAPSVPAVAEAPPITVPMASGDSSKPIVVAAQSRDVGQDLRERGIAHVVTGGLSG